MNTGTINFIAGGMLGDFIHALSVVKNICAREGIKADVYLTDNPHMGGDVWRLGASRAHHDLKKLVESQNYVNKFEILPPNFSESYVNLNHWRASVIHSMRQHGSYYKCWTDFLSEQYKYEIPKEYKWINTKNDDSLTKNKIVIHRSSHRHNPSFPWESILRNINEEIIFITCSQNEWDVFPFKNENITPKIVDTIEELAIGINSCKYFIGNQSAPFALASALDIPRLVELDAEPAGFYMNEIKYSKNISWFLNNEMKYITQNSLIKI